jgi:hypothetical protein
MAQPPLSVAIRQLERELGTQLLSRTTREDSWSARLETLPAIGRAFRASHPDVALLTEAMWNARMLPALRSGAVIRAATARNHPGAPRAPTTRTRPSLVLSWTGPCHDRCTRVPPTRRLCLHRGGGEPVDGAADRFLDHHAVLEELEMPGLSLPEHLLVGPWGRLRSGDEPRQAGRTGRCAPSAATASPGTERGLRASPPPVGLHSNDRRGGRWGGRAPLGGAA